MDCTVDPLSSSIIPASLLDRLSRDEDSLQLSLLHDALPASTAEAKALSERLLLQATPAAIRTLVQINSSGLPKDRLVAAAKLLDKSPATRDSAVISPASNVLSDQALNILMTGLAKFLEVSISPLASSAHPDSMPNTRILNAGS